MDNKYGLGSNKVAHEHHEASHKTPAAEMRCRFCGKELPPEHRHSDVCHGCAERGLGVVH